MSAIQTKCKPLKYTYCFHHPFISADRGHHELSTSHTTHTPHKPHTRTTQHNRSSAATSHKPFCGVRDQTERVRLASVLLPSPVEARQRQYYSRYSSNSEVEEEGVKESTSSSSVQRNLDQADQERGPIFVVFPRNKDGIARAR